MNLHPNYLYNEKGLKTAIQLPMNEWEKVMKDLKTYYELMDLKTNLKQAFKEVKQIQQGKIKPKTLKDVLNEL